MRKFFGPFQIVSILLAIGGLVARNPAIFVLGLVAWVGSVALSSMKESSRRHGVDHHEGRRVLRPVKRLYDEVEKLVSENKDNPTVKVIGAEALEEAKRLLERATALSVMIQDTRHARPARDIAKAEIESLKDRLAASESEEQRGSFGLAIQARENEVENYTKIIDTIEAAKAQLVEAEAALSAIKGQLAAAAVGTRSDDLDRESLSGMVGRLKSLSTSLEEVEKMKERLP